MNIVGGMARAYVALPQEEVVSSRMVIGVILLPPAPAGNVIVVNGIIVPVDHPDAGLPNGGGGDVLKDVVLDEDVGAAAPAVHAVVLRRARAAVEVAVPYRDVGGLVVPDVLVKGAVQRAHILDP